MNRKPFSGPTAMPCISAFTSRRHEQRAPVGILRRPPCSVKGPFLGHWTKYRRV